MDTKCQIVGPCHMWLLPRSSAGKNSAEGANFVQSTETLNLCLFTKKPYLSDATDSCPVYPLQMPIVASNTLYCFLAYQYHYFTYCVSISRHYASISLFQFIYRYINRHNFWVLALWLSNTNIETLSSFYYSNLTLACFPKCQT